MKWANRKAKRKRQRIVFKTLHWIKWFGLPLTKHWISEVKEVVIVIDGIVKRNRLIDSSKKPRGTMIACPITLKPYLY